MRLIKMRSFVSRALFLLLFLGAQAARSDDSGKRAFETRVLADQAPPGQHVTVTGETLRTAPGTLGDPFRVVGLLPGVATPVPVLPLYAIRGASPGMTGFFLDGMRLPQLFHMFVGGGVVHAGLVDRLDFYPGAYDVTLGRYAGGVISAETRAARRDRQQVEAELRLYDLSTLIELKLPRDVSISLSGHYGYPSLLLKLIRPGLDINYWDYQFRLDYHGLTIQALGWRSPTLNQRPFEEWRFLPLQDDIASTAFWYQSEPHGVFPAFPSLNDLEVV